MENSADPDQMASLDLHCFLQRIYWVSTGQGLRCIMIIGASWMVRTKCVPSNGRRLIQ